ncbi:MAG: hypothetical protein VYA69_04015 [Gemmatimonadota bacterium]|nr:hypothetical protein [Gemmatimonadota bacterium]
MEIVRIGDLRTTLAPMMVGDQPVTILVFWLPFLAAFLVYLLAASKVWDKRRAAIPQDIDSKHIPTFFILLFAVVFRVTLLFSPPTLSDDIFRYVWDGSIQNHGVNPYMYPPEASDISAFRDQYWSSINNKHIPTIYPPLLQLVFRVADLTAHTPMAMKVLFMVCDIGVIGIVLLLLRLYGLPLDRVLIYAWNPLVLVEFSGSGHNDTLALVLMMAALYAIMREREVLSILWLALSFLSQFFSVVLIPSVFFQVRRIQPFLLFPVVIVVFYLLYIDAGIKLFEGLMVYSDKWRFNDSIFTLALQATGSLTQAKIVIVAIFLAIILVRLVSGKDHMRTAYILVGAYLLLTPTLQVWYMVWIIPFLCIYPNRAWLLLSGLTVLSYNVLIQFIQTGIWHEAMWVRYAEYIPFYLLLIGDVIWKKAPVKPDLGTEANA